MTVTFKAIGKREREALKALGVRHIPNGTDGKPRGAVVTINGCIVLAFGHGYEVIYQDGSQAIFDLVRAHKRVSAALNHLTYDDFERIKRKGKRERTVEEILRGGV